MILSSVNKCIFEEIIVIELPDLKELFFIGLQLIWSGFFPQFYVCSEEVEELNTLYELRKNKFKLKKSRFKCLDIEEGIYHHVEG